MSCMEKVTLNHTDIYIIIKHDNDTIKKLMMKALLKISEKENLNIQMFGPDKL